MSSSVLSAGIRRLRGLVAGQHRQDESDDQLLHAFTSRRDESAFAALLRRHGPMVLGVCRRVLGHQQDAEDAFQATFLVLARGAAALRRKSALASFLHGTAHRIARTAKRAAARRRKYEGQAPTRTPDDPAGELSWREVQALLDEEIARLPDAYRSVFVLCCLEDLSRTEAARRLGLKDGTVSSRLAGARKRLQQRLSRRGVELTALLAATALATPPAQALPAVLLTTTTNAAVSPLVAALTDAVLKGLSDGKVKLATALLLMGSLLTGAGLWAYHGPIAPESPEEAPAAKRGDKPRTAPPKHEAAMTVEIQGRVLGPDGKPKAGVKLLLLGQGDKPEPLGRTAADGRFTVSVPKEMTYRYRVDFLFHYLVALSEDAGNDFLSLDSLGSAQPVEFRLVKDHAIRGRVVNTEGKPVASVHVAVQSITTYENNSLDPFLIAWPKHDRTGGIPGGVKELWSEVATLLATTTDSDGRFVLHGVGAERVVSLRLSGAGIADAEVLVVNREGFDPKPYNQATRDNAPKGEGQRAARWLHGPDVSFVAEAEKPIRGVVKDVDTGAVRPGVEVGLTRNSRRDLVRPVVWAKTDARGRFELHGARKAKQYMLEVRDDPSAGYMGCQVWADDTAGYEPITVDIGVKKGVVITGKVIDKATGKPVPGFAEAAVLPDNPFAPAYRMFNWTGLYRPAQTTEEGVFLVVAIPGPVLLMGGPDIRRLPRGLLDAMPYKQPVADANYPQYFLKMADHTMYYGYGESDSLHGNFCKVLELKPGIAEVHQDIVLERADALAVKIQDAEGRPLHGAWATGLHPKPWMPALRIEDDSCSAYEVKADKPRLLVFYQPEKKLAGTRMLRGDEKQPVLVKLGPAGAIGGRLLDRDGKPLARIMVQILYRDRAAQQVHRVISEAQEVVTDTTGAFRFDGLIPNLKFAIYSLQHGKTLLEDGSKPRDFILHAVKAGETLDLGTIKLKQLSDNPGE
jgi:RNA polymerase sigma factor (sigma-70 family)